MSGTWSAAEVGGKAADVYDPPGPGRSRFGVLHLHDAGAETLRDNGAFTRLFAELRLACVCPHGGSCWWADRVCAEFDPKVTPERYLLERVVPFFQARWGLAPRAVGLTGIGMGGQGALRLSFKHPETFPAVAAISPAIEYHELYGRGTPLDDMYDSKEQCRQDTAIMHVHPTHYPPHLFFCIDPADPWYRGSDRLHEKLSALGVPHTPDLTTRAGGHSRDYFNHMADRAVRFVAEGLEQEARRLL
jgi:poly(3-hydroxybutyrate) depolymerase